MIYEIHEFQHEYDQVIRTLTQTVDGILNQEGLKTGSPSLSELRRLMRKIKETFEEFTGAPISVNIRIYANENESASPGAVSTSHTYLQTLERVASNKEVQTSKKNNNGRERTFEEKFYLGKIRYKKESNIKDWINDEIIHQDKVLKREGQKYKINSAYNYVLGNDKSYFISNNLDKDTKEGIYYSSSSDYLKFYNSLAIVRIGPYFNKRIPNDPLNTTNGLLIIDSLETGIFDYAFTRQLLGYYAHRLHPVVEYYKKVVL